VELIVWLIKVEFITERFDADGQVLLGGVMVAHHAYNQVVVGFEFQSGCGQVVTTWMCDCLLTSRYTTNRQSQLSFLFF